MNVVFSGGRSGHKTPASIGAAFCTSAASSTTTQAGSPKNLSIFVVYALVIEAKNKEPAGDGSSADWRLLARSHSETMS